MIKKSYKIDELITKITTSLNKTIKTKKLYNSVSKELKKSTPINIKGLSKYKSKQKIEWGGYTRYYGIFFSDYLVYKYSNVCAIKDITLEFDNYLHFRKGSSTFKINDVNIINQVKSQLDKCNKRFIIFIVKVASHQNIIIYDTSLNEIELFDPYGANFLKQIIKANNLLGLKGPEFDKQAADYVDNYYNSIKKFFKDLVNYKSFYLPIDFFPKDKDFQDLEIEMCPKQHFNINSWGFCVVWSFWYAEMRVSHPNKSREKLVKNLIDLFEKEVKNFKSQKNTSVVIPIKERTLCKVVRGYTSFLVNLDSNKSFLEKNLLWFNVHKDFYFRISLVFIAISSIFNLPLALLLL